MWRALSHGLDPLLPFNQGRVKVDLLTTAAIRAKFRSMDHWSKPRAWTSDLMWLG
ncbi:hypothetical protein B0G76_8221 [Paraburkholderia sp. BL23I1N1]|nr:hypothetical protein B0G76_8221 [Paraburkholderia sp. BL23I1N1]